MLRQYFHYAKVIKTTPFTTMAAITAITAFSALISSTAFAGDQHEHKGPPEVNAFHSVMAPLWHAPAGKTRLPNACAKASNMVTLANKIKNSNAATLKEATGIFQDKCKTKPANPADTEAAFAQVHEAFHKIIEAQ